MFHWNVYTEKGLYKLIFHIRLASSVAPLSTLVASNNVIVATVMSLNINSFARFDVIDPDPFKFVDIVVFRC